MIDCKSARRASGDELAIYDFRGALPDTGASTVTRLGNEPLAAAEFLISGLDRREAWPAERTGLDGIGGLGRIADAAG